MSRAFVIRPFDKKTDSKGREIDFELVHRTLIQPALDAAGLSGSTTGEIVDAGNIRQDMFGLILEADLVVADVSIHNPNVFYELGIRHALRKRSTVMIRQSGVADPSPFDLLTDRFLKYNLDSPEGIEASRQQLIQMITASLKTLRETDSPVFEMLAGLPEVDPAVVQPLPPDFQEEVKRAQAAKSKGWLRQLVDDVKDRRFKWPAMELLGQAQLDLKDFEGARSTWEAVRQVKPDDVRANLGLANAYERLSREAKEPETKTARLTESGFALDRTLAVGEKQTSPQQRLEALGLKARNLKTRWRMGFEDLEEQAMRRSAAFNGLLKECYDAYREAFYADLNHYWSGLAALQMAVILVDLSKDQSPDDESELVDFGKSLERSLAKLREAVSTSAEAALRRSPKDVWAKVTQADLYFLASDNVDPVFARYRDALHGQEGFVYDSATGQLKLFASLGVRKDGADEVVRRLSALRKQDPPPARPRYVVIFAGHRIDADDRPEPRFPASQAEAARAAISQALRKIPAKYEVLGLASGASGGDILFHEECFALGYRSEVCLPFRADLYAGHEFGTLDDWRTRFHALRERGPVRELSDQAALPRWLYGSSVNAWERGNRWVLKMAQASNASKVSLLALWDGKRAGGDRGGTADMVHAAREAGNIEVTVLDTAKLNVSVAT